MICVVCFCRKRINCFQTSTTRKSACKENERRKTLWWKKFRSVPPRSCFWIFEPFNLLHCCFIFDKVSWDGCVLCYRRWKANYFVEERISLTIRTNSNGRWSNVALKLPSNRYCFYVVTCCTSAVFNNISGCFDALNGKASLTNDKQFNYKNCGTFTNMITWWVIVKRDNFEASL